MTVIINGSNTPTAGAVAVGDGTTLNFTAAGTAGQVLTSNGAGVPTWTDNGSGTVSSVSGTGTVSGLSLSGTVTTSGSLTLGGTLAVTPSNFSSQTANYILAAPNGSSGVPTFRAIVAADIPTLNQNTTGTASNVTGIVAINNGGTGVGSAGGVTAGGFYVPNSVSPPQFGTLPVTVGGTGVATLTGVLKGNGTSAFSAATAGTDYLAPPSGTAILKANSGGALANATAGTDYCAATSGSGILKGSSGNTTTATAGTDYVAPATATTFTGTQTFNGTTSTLASVLVNAAEKATVNGASITGSVTINVTDQAVVYYNGNAIGNWALNITGNSGVNLNSILSTERSVTVAVLCTQGSTAYYNTSVQIDGTTSGVTTKWQGGTAPTSGNASSIDVYTYTIIKTASATYTVLASQTKFA